MTKVEIDRAAFLRDMHDVSAFGATAEGGLNREAASADDGRARDWLRARCVAEGMPVTVDGVGNMYAMLDIASPDAPCVLGGSHLDSQPNGGRFDGALGIVSALHAVLAVKRARETGALRPQRNVGLVNWTNEEGSRFAPSIMGSAVFAGALPAPAALAATDRDGVSLEDALRAIGYLGRDPAPRNIASYVELHIEQGVVLETSGSTIGVVEGNWGAIKYTVEFRGVAAHTGPTPMPQRRDALLPAAELILFTRQLSDETGGALLSSVGRLDVAPNSTNIVAERVRVFAELRDVERDRLAAACRALEAKIQALGRGDVSATIEKPTDRAPALFDQKLRDCIEAAAADRGLASRRLHTVAGHDAVAVGRILPAGMIFVPSINGVSHHPAESTSEPDQLNGVQVLADVLARLVEDASPEMKRK